jgi:hypothetical protein
MVEAGRPWPTLAYLDLGWPGDISSIKAAGYPLLAAHGEIVAIGIIGSSAGILFS